MSDLLDMPGWYGKVPALGDFTSRHLPESFVQRCDEWLSQGIHASRQQLGDRWLQTYLTAPVWRFAWAPGLAGPSWWMGVMMPSVDNVGRYFPLVVAQPFATPPLHGASQQAVDHWFQYVTQTAMAMLQPGMNLDRFESQLAQVPTCPASSHQALPSYRRLVGRDRFDWAAHPGLPQWMSGMAQQMWLQQVQGHSLWWLAQSPHGSSFSLSPGLPRSDQFVELLQGSW
ncbi:MAG: type VI secretion system-associated protein TagF [Aquabacterium sp.]